MLQAGIELVGVPAPTGTAEALELLCAALDAVGLRGLPRRAGRRLALPRAARRARGRRARRARPLLHELATRDFVGLEREVARLGLPETLLELPQRRGGPEVLDAAGQAGAGLRAVLRPARPGVAERIIFDLGLARPLGYYTGAVFEVYDAALGAPLGGGGRYDDLIAPLRPRPAGGRLGAERGAAAPRAGGRAPRGAGMSGLNDLTLAVPRGALFGDTLDLLDRLGVDTAEVRANDRRLLFAESGIVTMRPSDVPTYVEAGAADIGITGKDVLAEQSERAVYELLDLEYGACVMVLATDGGRGPGRGGAAAARRDAGRDEVPEDRRAPLRAHGPPGGDRGGQGIGGAGAAHRPRRGDRRPDRDGHDAARERARRARGDPGLDGAADRQPGRPQAQGGRARRRRRADQGGR